MDQIKIKSQLDQWLIEFVEAKHPDLANWAPCPYARAARLSGMIEVVFATLPTSMSVIKKSIDTLVTKDVVVICFDHKTISPEYLREYVADTNKILMPNDYVILEDHPDAPEYVNGVKMNFEHCGLLVIQKLSKLNNHANKLKEQGYYDSWDQAALDDVVSWRYEK
jgi:hypothetical protein